MTEEQFLGQVTDMATRFGWRWWHFAMPARHAAGGKLVPDQRGAGICDLMLSHHDPICFAFAELKTNTGKLTDAQREFLMSIRAATDVIRNQIRRQQDAINAHRDAGDISYWVAQALRQDWTCPVGVYVWTPADTEIIEGILRTRVLFP